MDVIVRAKIVIPDNENRAPNIHPIPQQAFTATIGHDAHQEALRIILGDPK